MARCAVISNSVRTTIHSLISAVQDITAWVDFTRVGEAALAAGLEVTGFATQAAFLLGNGIEPMLSEAADVAGRARLAGEARRLLLPGEMGESFKVMALCRNLRQPLAGICVSGPEEVAVTV